jgi:hypothetical protein
MRTVEDDEQEFCRCQRAVSVHPGRVGSQRTRDRFVRVPLWWAERAAGATRTQKAFVWIWLLHLAWKTKSNTFLLPNGQLESRGVGRWTKTRALRELEVAGMIRVSWANRKSPTVTLFPD